MTQLDELASILTRHAPEDGAFSGVLPGVTLYRSAVLTDSIHTLYEPTLCLIAQGSKRAMLGETAWVYDRGKYLICAVDLPMVGGVIRATEAEPYLCLRFDLDLKALGEMVLAHGAGRLAPPTGLAPALAVSTAGGGLLDACTRLARLLDTPEDAAALRPLVEREIYYRLMTGDQAEMLRHIVNGESRLAQIARVTAWLKDNYASPFTVEQLASIASMSPSSFFEHFKAVTQMTPLQYRNQLRLQEARRLMVIEGQNAASAGFEVGFESPSQFSREYVRLFGASPARDAIKLRETPAYAMVS